MPGLLSWLAFLLVSREVNSGVRIRNYISPISAHVLYLYVHNVLRILSFDGCACMSCLRLKRTYT